MSLSENRAETKLKIQETTVRIQDWIYVPLIIVKMVVGLLPDYQNSFIVWNDYKKLKTLGNSVEKLHST